MDRVAPTVHHHAVATSGQSNVIAETVDVRVLPIATVLSCPLIGKGDVQIIALSPNSLGNTGDAKRGLPGDFQGGRSCRAHQS